MPRKKRPQGEAAETTRRTVTNDFATFVGQVEAELASRIGGLLAADHVARDPSFGNVFRLCFDMRNAVGNPIKKCAGIIIDALAPSIVRDRLRESMNFGGVLDGTGRPVEPLGFVAAKIDGQRPGDIPTGADGVVLRQDVRPGDVATHDDLDALATVSGGTAPTLGEQLAGNPVARDNEQSWDQTRTSRRRPLGTGTRAESKTGGAEATEGDVREQLDANAANDPNADGD